MEMKKPLADQQAKGSHPAGKFRQRCRALGMLCSTYYELECNADTDEVKKPFDEL